VLGEVLYETIVIEFENDTWTGDNELLYTKYIKPFLIHASAMEYLKIGAYQVSNGGIYKHTPDNGTPVDKIEVDIT